MPDGERPESGSVREDVPTAISSNVLTYILSRQDLPERLMHLLRGNVYDFQKKKYVKRGDPLMNEKGIRGSPLSQGRRSALLCLLACELLSSAQAQSVRPHRRRRGTGWMTGESCRVEESYPQGASRPKDYVHNPEDLPSPLSPLNL